MAKKQIWWGYKTWADGKYAQLMKKGKTNWDEDDWEAFSYIENCWGERDRQADREAMEEGW